MIIKSIFTSGIATVENTTFGIHERNKNRPYTEKAKFSVSSTLLIAIIQCIPNAPAIIDNMMHFLASTSDQNWARVDPC